MNDLRQTDIEQLVAARPGPCLSFYIPFYPGGRDAQGDLARLESASKQAHNLLLKRGLRQNEADALLAPLEKLPQDNEQWRHRGPAIAAFVAPQFFRAFRLPDEVREDLFVDEHFHLRPLLPLVNSGDRFFVLALSQTSHRLLAGDNRGLKEMEPLTLISPRDKPLSPDDDLVADGTLQTHIQQIARAVEDRLEGEQAPLILAGGEDVASAYRRVSQYEFLTDEHINGNPDLWSAHELHTRAWPLVEPSLVQNRESHRKRMLLHRDGVARHGLADVIPAAMEGRIDALFIDCSQPHWGHLDSDGKIALHNQPRPGDEDLVELAVAETLRHRGQVFAVSAEEIGMDDEAEALLRY
jgi:hypothetical protein